MFLNSYLAVLYDGQYNISKTETMVLVSKHNSLIFTRSPLYSPASAFWLTRHSRVSTTLAGMRISWWLRYKHDLGAPPALPDPGDSDVVGVGGG